MHVFCLFISCCWISNYKEGGGILLTGLTPQHLCACPKPWPEFTTTYIVVFLIFNELRWMFDHHCISLIMTILEWNKCGKYYIVTCILHKFIIFVFLAFYWTRGHRGRDRLKSVPITTKVVSSTQHYVIKFGRWFSPCTPVSSTNKTHRQDITEIFL
jgi:hypothetical protein